ncbi:MAG TPA: hypothetical protein VFO40_01920, partial [Chthoniobacterales bacterium]|nr:hypothetical protein [Chthoniobacterales bacterium]
MEETSGEGTFLPTTPNPQLIPITSHFSLSPSPETSESACSVPHALLCAVRYLLFAIAQSPT